MSHEQEEHEEQEEECPKKTKPDAVNNPNDPNYQFCGVNLAQGNLASVKVFVVINRGQANERVIPGFWTGKQHQRNHRANFTLSASAQVILKKNDTIEVVVVPGQNGETYRANANVCALTVERVRLHG